MLLRKGNQMSKFKPGDWVVNTTTDDYYDGIRNWFQLKETDLIFKQNVNAAEWEANFYFVNAHEIWQPKVGEWVVIADDITPDLYAVFQFNNHSTDRQILPLVFLQSLKDNS
jgi:hypothetical protein